MQNRIVYGASTLAFPGGPNCMHQLLARERLLRVVQEKLQKSKLQNSSWNNMPTTAKFHTIKIDSHVVKFGHGLLFHVDRPQTGPSSKLGQAAMKVVSVRSNYGHNGTIGAGGAHRSFVPPRTWNRTSEKVFTSAASWGLLAAFLPHRS